MRHLQPVFIGLCLFFFLFRVRNTVISLPPKFEDSERARQRHRFYALCSSTVDKRV